MVKSPRIPNILMALAAATGIVPTTPALASNVGPTPVIAITGDGQTLQYCIDPNIRRESRRIKKITEANIEQILDKCLDAHNFIRAINILIPRDREGNINRRFNERGWNVLDQLFSIYDEKVKLKAELTANLQDGARNSATGKEWTGKSRDQFQAELSEVEGWLRTVNEAFNPEYKDKVKRHAELTANLPRGARNPVTNKKWTKEEKEGFRKELSDIEMYFDRANIFVLKQWRDANAPYVALISLIPPVLLESGETLECQTEVRKPSKDAPDSLRESFMTCGTWRAPQVGPLRYQFRVNYGQMQTPPVPVEQPAAPAQQLQPQ